MIEIDKLKELFKVARELGASKIIYDGEKITIEWTTAELSPPILEPRPIMPGPTIMYGSNL